MAYDPRKGRLEASEYDREFSVKVAKQNLQRKTIISLVMIFALIALALAIIIVI